MTKALARQVETRFFHFTATGLVVEGDPDYDRWADYGLVLGKLKDGCAWSIGDWVNYGEERFGEKYAQALDATGRSEGGLRNLAYVASRFDLSRRRDIGWSLHAAVAPLDPGDADALLDEAVREGLTRADLRDRLRQTRHAARTVGRAWPAGTYGVILWDPPWRFDEGATDPTRQAENQYPTMTLDELLGLAEPVRALAADDCVLLTWVPLSKVTEYAALVDALGFEHKTGAGWVKDTIGMGSWFRQRLELLLLATRGAPAAPLESARPDAIIAEPRRGHSQKPDRQYALIDVMFPGVPKVELFARACDARPDAWATWGNEALGGLKRVSA